MSKPGLKRSIFLASILCAAAVTNLFAQTLTTLVMFDQPNGPAYGPLVQGFDGNLYGTTETGGNYGSGEVYKLTLSSGTLSTFYSFCAQNCEDGSVPVAGLIQAVDGNLYGMTFEGGILSCGSPYGCGTVFKISAKGKFTQLHAFSGQGDSGFPYDSLVQASNGTFYGTASGGGPGAIFKMTAAGKLTPLFVFGNGTADGFLPFGPMIQGIDGNFYGTTSLGGAFGPCNDDCGTVFRVTARGKETILHSFDSADGALPIGGLVQASDGNFYGTTSQGGDSTNCSGGCGTVFQMTSTGSLTSLHSFNGFDGTSPYGTLVQGTDGNLYGTTAYGGVNNACEFGCGTIFRITIPAGQLTTLYNFCSQSGCTDGFSPWAGLMQGTDGNFYGTTFYGGASCPYGCGTVFSLNVALGPFVETLPTSGKVGAKVVILGNNLKGATKVAFNGTPATFSATGTSIKTTVPAGATNGFVTVTTPNGTLTSNLIFQVK